MSNFKLNLPTDIPWVRRCVSNDMIDRNLCDRTSPLRWRSSIAIFEYEPDEENQTYQGMTITYLKVSCSITGYQENPEEVGVNRKGLSSYWQDQPGIANYLNLLQAYYPCYGAILEVAVGPEDERNTPIGNFPYFLDFDPKKRELYELVTDTGETMSRSLETIELGKSNTSVTSHEVVDIDKGWSASGEVGVGAVKVGLAGSRQGEWGTRDVTKEEAQNLRNTDASQEMRETKSHTTQLTQMYHQLDSYHLGTNRAVFFVHPRPHTIETEHTFVNGPRNIEGIQEFMFVVVRPRTIEKLCVEAYLETGHIGKVPRTELQEIPGTELNVIWNDQYHAQPKGDDDSTTVVDDTDRVWDVNSHNPGYRIKSATITAGPATIRYNYDEPKLIDVHPHISDQNEDFVRVSGKVHSGFANYAVDSDRWEEITYPFRVDIVLVKKEVVYKSDDTLFLTARQLCCCERPLRLTPFDGIVYEKTLDKLAVAERYGEGMPISEANRQAVHIREAVLHSRNDTDHRHAQPVHLAQADFATRSAARLLPRAARTKLAEQDNLPARLREQLAHVSERLTAGEVLGMPARMVEDVFSLSPEDAAELRATLLGIANTRYDKRRAWLSDKQLQQLFNKGPTTPRSRKKS
ncbi:MAG TPA: hypothetical protein VF682_11285 [Pseudomonas sp.]|jgi:hypothetical protein